MSMDGVQGTSSTPIMTPQSGPSSCGSVFLRLSISMGDVQGTSSTPTTGTQQGNPASAIQTGCTAAAACPMKGPSQCPWTLPPKHLYTCTVGRNRSQARCGLLLPDLSYLRRALAIRRVRNSHASASQQLQRSRLQPEGVQLPYKLWVSGLALKSAQFWAYLCSVSERIEGVLQMLLQLLEGCSATCVAGTS